jgi:hypothetical protein
VRSVSAALSLLMLTCGNQVTDDLELARDFEYKVAEACSVTLIGDPLVPALRDALSNGRTTFEPDAARRCLDRLRATGCEPEEGALGALAAREPGWCRQAYSGSLDAGEACEHDAECAGDAYCSAEYGTTAECVARNPPGTACTNANSCSAPDDAVADCVEGAAAIGQCSAS